MTQHYSIGTLGQPWSDADKQLWREQQRIQRSYAEEVLSKLADLPAGLVCNQYGALPYDEQRYPLFAVMSEVFSADKPTVLVTGGVHGYETSGVQGALQFIQHNLSAYSDAFNFIVVPCVSPWGYETINRWNPLAVDPNRSFRAESPSSEAQLLMSFVQSLNITINAHFDLHETTDTDNSEFRPALAARDGIENVEWAIPDGFYLVANTNSPQLAFQRSIIEAVEQVTHIAPADEHGCIIGSKVEQHGVIFYDKHALHLCGGFTHAHYCTTTEVYPDSPKTDPQNCNDAQVAAICGGLDYLLTRI